MRMVILSCALVVPRLALAASGFVPEGTPGVFSSDPRATAARAAAPEPAPAPAPTPEPQPQAAPEPDSKPTPELQPELQQEALEPSPPEPAFGLVGTADRLGEAQREQPELFVMPVFSFLRLLGGAGLNLDIGAVFVVQIGDPMDMQVGMDFAFGITSDLEAYPTGSDGEADYLADKRSRGAKFSLFNIAFSPLAFHYDLPNVRLTGGAGMVMGVIISPSADTDRGESLGGVMPLGIGPGFNFGVMTNLGGVAWLGGQWRLSKYFVADFTTMSLDLVAAF